MTEGGGGAQNIQVYNLTRMFEQDKYYISQTVTNNFSHLYGPVTNNASQKSSYGDE